MRDLLKEWNLESLWETFEYHEITDVETLGEFLLTSSPGVINEIIPKVGVRMKLLKKYREQFQLQNNTSQLYLSLNESSVPTKDFIIDVPGTSFGPVYASDTGSKNKNLENEERSVLELFSGLNNQPILNHKALDFDVIDDLNLELNSSISEEPPAKKKKIIDIEYINTIEVLNDHPLGPSVISYYKVFSELDNRIQGRLCDIVSLFYLRRYGMTLNEKHLERLACDFVKHFPNECVQSYFIASVPKNKSPTGKAIGAKGKLVNAYKNHCTYIREGLHWDQQAGSEPKNTTSNTETTTAEEKSKDWLLHNRDLDEVLIHWELSYDLRRHEITSKKFKTVSDIYEDWPILKENIGYQLIEKDFAKILGNTNFSSNWNVVFTKTIKYFQERSKNIVITDLDLLEDANLSENSKCILQTKILIHLLAPKSNKTSKSKSGKNNKGFWRPDATDSQNGVFIHVKIPGDIEKSVRKKTKKMSKLGLNLQPFIILVGQDLVSINKFYVRVDAIQYELQSFLKCLEIVLKLSLVFQVSYPLESENFWYFIQWSVSEITTDTDTKIPSIFDICHKLKRR